MNPVVLNRGVRSCPSQTYNFACPVTRLLEHLALCRLKWRLIAIHHPAGYFERHLFNSMPVLLDHYNLFAWGERNDVDPVGRFDAIEIVLASRSGVNAPIA